MPTFISDIHGLIVQNYINRKDGTNSNSQYRNVYGMTRNGFVFPITLYIDNVFPNFDDFLVGGVLIRSRKNSQIVLLDRQANIFGVTRPFYELFSNRLLNKSDRQKFSNHDILECNLEIFMDGI